MLVIDHTCGGIQAPQTAEAESGGHGPGKKDLDLKVSGYPVFMLVAYPPGKTGKRKRIQLHFHLMQKTKPDKPDPPPAPTDGAEASGKSFPLTFANFEYTLSQ